jgi:GT2 family glycosyltransferase
LLNLSIIIVNWNTGDQLKNCIDSIKSCQDSSNLPLIIIDNASSDNSIDLIRATPQILLIELKNNVGFAKACNLGASLAYSKYLLFLNPDTLVFDGTFKFSVEFMESSKNNRVGICGVQLVDESSTISRSCSQFPTPLRLILQSLGVDRYLTKFSHFLTSWDHKSVKLVDQVIGAYFLVKSNLFIQLNGFDERFFLYYEEVDFSYRARLAGWFSAYISDVKVFHAGGGSSNQIKAKRLFYVLRSKIIYSFKHFSFFSALLVTFSILFFEPFARILWCLKLGSPSGVKELCIAYFFLIKWMLCLPLSANKYD